LSLDGHGPSSGAFTKYPWMNSTPSCTARPWCWRLPRASATVSMPLRFAALDKALHALLLNLNSSIVPASANPSILMKFMSMFGEQLSRDRAPVAEVLPEQIESRACAGSPPASLVCRHVTDSPGSSVAWMQRALRFDPERFQLGIEPTGASSLVEDGVLRHAATKIHEAFAVGGEGHGRADHPAVDVSSSSRCRSAAAMNSAWQ